MIGVEVALGEETWCAVFECAKIADGGRGLVETDIASYVAAAGVGCVVFEASGIDFFEAIPGSVGACLAACDFLAAVCTAIEDNRIVGIGAFGSSIGVNGDEVVDIIGFNLFADLRERTIVLVIGGRCRASRSVGCA